MSISLVFGENLRRLCASRTSISYVARKLDISRVQFNRYLKGESFPKPAILDRICNYFDVDARIYTETFSIEQLEKLRTTGAKYSADTNKDMFMAAYDFAASGIDFFVPYDLIADGIHSIWRTAFSNDTDVVHMLIQIKTVNGARVVKGFDIGPKTSDASGRIDFLRLEFRGMLLNQQDGIAMVIYNRSPVQALSTAFFGSYLHFPFALMPGYATLHRKDYKGAQRIVRSVLQIRQQTTHEILAAARTTGFITMKNVPEIIRRELSKSLESDRKIPPDAIS